MFGNLENEIVAGHEAGLLIAGIASLILAGMIIRIIMGAIHEHRKYSRLLQGQNDVPSPRPFGGAR